MGYYGQGNGMRFLSSPANVIADHWRMACMVPCILFALFCGSVSCSRNDDPARPVKLGEMLQHGSAAGFNVLLVTLDTTRPDYLGCYGNEQAETPTIDGLAARGVRFDDAVTSVPVTLPAHATILTGHYPPAIGVRDNGSYQLAEEHQTLAEILKDNGYDTAAFVASFVLDERFGLNQGFDFYEFKAGADDRPAPLGRMAIEHERRADVVSDSAQAWLDSRRTAGDSAPFFMWVHYYDPHAPYAAPLGSAERFRGRAYEAEIAFVDLHLKRLLAVFDAQALRERTLIVLVSDHGEGLGEHGEALHGVLIYESTVHVALILSCPTLFDGPYRVDDRVVATVDILPTVLDLLGLPAVTSVDGQSLLTVESSPERAVYIETQVPIAQGCSPLYCLRRHTDKYIQAPQSEYYSLPRDPEELRNLHDNAPAELDVLKQQLAEVMKAWPEDDTTRSATRVLSDEERRILESLGYVGGDGEPQADLLRDPKEHIHSMNKMMESARLAAEGNIQAALELAMEVAAENQEWYDPVHSVAELQWKLGNREEAVRVLEEYAERFPSSASLYQLAKTLLASERYEECLEKLVAAEQFDSQAGAIPMLRGHVFYRQGRYAEAMREYERALKIDRERIGVEAQQKLEQRPALANKQRRLGNIALKQNRLDEAVMLLEDALRLEPESAATCESLGLALARQGRIDQALPYFQKVVDLKPDSAEVHNNLGNLLAQLGELESAAEHFTAALRFDPDLAEARVNLGLILFKLGHIDEATTRLREAVRKHAEFLGAYHSLAQVLMAQSRLDEAIEVYESALRIVPKDARLLAALEEARAKRDAADED